MKKRLLSMLMVLVLMTGMLTVPALAADPTCATCSGPVTLSAGDANGHVVTCDTDAAHNTTAAHTLVRDYNDTEHWDKCADGCGYTTAVTTHTYAKDNAKSTDAKGVYTCTGCVKTVECAHTWGVWADAGNGTHTRSCSTTGCIEGKQIANHVWKYVSTDATGTIATHTCEAGCGVENKTEHVCKFSGATGFDAWTKDATGHWHACIGCDVKHDFSAHADGDAEGTCDVCAMAMSSNIVHKQMIISSGGPVANQPIHFTATVSPSAEYGAPTVKWNRVINLSANTSTAMTKENVFSPGKMYNTSITMMINKNATFASDFYIELDGERVPFYTNEADFNKQIATYNGNNTVSAALRSFNSSGYCYITVVRMYKQLDGECAHEWVKMQGKTTHWEECKFCGQLYGGYTKHFDKNANGICDNCGYNIYGATSTGSGSTHAHSWSTDWVEDISNHWKQCVTCGAKKDTAAHADPNGNGKCDVCGFVMTAAEGHTHTFATTWTETAFQHWHECSCGAKNDIGAHVDKNNSGLCDQCGYTMTAALNAAANGTVANVGSGTATNANGVPVTGDTTSLSVIGLWAAALAVSVVGLGGAALAWRKRKES